MFIIKATYRSETRKFSFPDTSFFPSYDQLYHQLYRVFPISHNYYLSRLLFSPDSSKPSRILIGREVHSEQEFNACIAPFRGRAWHSALLRLSIYDETPHKIPSMNAQRAEPWSRSSSVIHSHSLSQSSPPMDIQSDILPSQRSFTSSRTPLSPSHVPPPPIIFSSPPREVSQAPMDIDTAHPDGTPQRRTWSETTNTWTLPPQQSQHDHHKNPCCSVAEGKAEVEALLGTFKRDLDRILTNTFGSAPAPTPAPAPAPAPIFQAPLGFGPYQPLYGCYPPSLPAIPTHSIPPMTFRSAPTPPPRWCATCARSFNGPWYKCDSCFFYVMCPDCFERGQPAEVHRFIYDEAHVMLRQEPTSGPSTMPASPSLRNTVPLQPTPPVESPPSEAVVHKNVICDMCNKVIVGVRHKCLDCADYDLCSPCIDLGSAEIHDPFHEFFDIEEPGRVIVHTVFSGDGERDAPTPAARNSRNAQTQLNSTPPPVPVTHNAFCDLCDSKIIGERYKCLNCPDFDTCTACFSITPEQHPTHGFVKIMRREDLMLRNALTANSHIHLATCNECKKTIHGTRYKCMHPDCPDFDLCAGCEALPIPVHPALHPMLKMRIPDTVVPTVYRVGATEFIPPVQSSDQRTRSPSPSTTDQSRSRSPSPVRVPGAFSHPGSGWSAILHARSAVGTPRNPFASTSTLGSLPALQERVPSPVVNSPEPEVSQEDEHSCAHSDTVSPSADASSSRFMLPPLALDPTRDLFREFWPRVAQELKMLMQESSNTAPPAHTGSPPQVTEIHRPDTTKSESHGTNVTAAIAPEPPQEPERDNSNLAAVNRSLALAAVLEYQSPSVAVSSPLATSLSSLNEKESIGIPETGFAEDLALSGAFLSHTTVPDGQVFPPGAEFVKSWHMVNDGGRAWPDSTELVFVAGERLARDENVPQKVKIGAVQSDDEVDVWTGELKAPDATGRYVSYWRLSDGEGNLFGQSIWIDITVAELGHRSERSSEHSLASSSIVMPHSASVRGTAQCEGRVVEQTLSFVSMSPVTAASRLTTNYEASDNGSDASSVSLISVPSSEDDIDEAEWEDSRSHVLVPPPDGTRAGMEYVVLYDESSDEE